MLCTQNAHVAYTDTRTLADTDILGIPEELDTSHRFIKSTQSHLGREGRGRDRC